MSLWEAQRMGTELSTVCKGRKDAHCFPKSILLAVLLFAFTSFLWGQGSTDGDTQAGDFLFRMPSGWKQQQNENMTVLSSPATDSQTVAVIVLATYPLDTNLKATFNKLWTELQKSYKVQQSGQITRQQIAGGHRALVTSATLVDNKGVQLAALFLVARNGPHAEGVLFLTNSLQAQSYSAQKALLENFLVSLQFTSAVPGAEAPPAPSPVVNPAYQPGSDAATVSPNRTGTPGGPARFNGIYRAAAKPGEDTTSALATADPAARAPRYKFLVFFSDGTVKRGLIDKGFGEVVQESAMRLDISSGGKFATQWGKYQFSAGRGRIVFASAVGGQQLVSGLRGNVWNVVQYPDRLEINGDVYLLLEGGTGLLLDGIYKPAGDRNQPGIKFTRDGQFVDQGIIDTGGGMAISGGGVIYAFESPKAGRGTYTISNYGLHLNYTNTQAPSLLFYIEPGTSKNDVPTVYINNFRYQRVP